MTELEEQGQPVPLAMIEVGMLDTRAIVKPPPDYPKLANAAGLRGRTLVKVVVDELGNVESAVAVSGHPFLSAACVAAALRAKFTPILLTRQAVRFTGILTYGLEHKQSD